MKIDTSKNWVDTDINVISKLKIVMGDFNGLKPFYEELKQRYVYLTYGSCTEYDSLQLKERLSELELAIVRIQQMMLVEIK